MLKRGSMPQYLLRLAHDALGQLENSLAPLRLSARCGSDPLWAAAQHSALPTLTAQGD